MADFVEVINGVLLPKLSPERWEYLKSYSLRPDDVFIVTYPRSGTTWTQQIVRLLRNKGEEDDGQQLDVAVPWLEMLDCAYGRQMGYSVAMETSLPSPRTFKSHFPYSLVPGGLPHTTQAKYIYVARNPKDTLVSVWHHKNRMILPGVKDTWKVFMSNILSGKTGLYGNWFDHVLEWWKHKDEENILFLKYEDLKKDLSQSVHTISHFIGIEDATSELIDKVVEQSSFESMSQDPNANYTWMIGSLMTAEGTFMRKGVVGDWKNYFSSEQNASFDKIYREKMEGSGLEFDFE